MTDTATTTTPPIQMIMQAKFASSGVVQLSYAIIDLIYAMMTPHMVYIRPYLLSPVPLLNLHRYQLQLPLPLLQHQLLTGFLIVMDPLMSHQISMPSATHNLIMDLT
jgi:hypothetical protein